MAEAMQCKKYIDCGDEFVNASLETWKVRCLRCFRMQRDSSEGRDSSRSPRRPASADTIFKIDMHRGKTFQQVKNTDASYTQWARNFPQPPGQMAEFVDWLEGRQSRYHVVKPPQVTLEVSAVHAKLMAVKQQPLTMRKRLHRELLLEHHPHRSDAAQSKSISQYLSQANAWLLAD
jgi:hypothetical protein